MYFNFPNVGAYENFAKEYCNRRNPEVEANFRKFFYQGLLNFAQEVHPKELQFISHYRVEPFSDTNQNPILFRNITSGNYIILRVNEVGIKDEESKRIRKLEYRNNLPLPWVIEGVNITLLDVPKGLPRYWQIINFFPPSAPFNLQDQAILLYPNPDRVYSYYIDYYQFIKEDVLYSDTLSSLLVNKYPLTIARFINYEVLKYLGEEELAQRELQIALLEAQKIKMFEKTRDIPPVFNINLNIKKKYLF